MRSITQRQTQIFEYIKNFFIEKGYWPSIRDIQKEFNFKSTNAVIGHLRSLEQKSYLSRVPGQARAYHINELENTSHHQRVVSLPLFEKIPARWDIDPKNSALHYIKFDCVSIHVDALNSKPYAITVHQSFESFHILAGDTLILEPVSAKLNDLLYLSHDGHVELYRYSTTHMSLENKMYGVVRGVIRKI